MLVLSSAVQYSSFKALAVDFMNGWLVWLRIRLYRDLPSLPFSSQILVGEICILEHDPSTHATQQGDSQVSTSCSLILVDRMVLV